MNFLGKEMMGMSLKTILILIGLLSIWMFFLFISIIFTKSNGCVNRYSEGGNGSMVTKTVDIALRADGKYHLKSGEDEYGKWLNTDINIDKNSDITIKVNGKVSLCRAYLPKYNTAIDDNKNAAEKLIPIPKIDEEIYSNSKLFTKIIKQNGLPLILDNAKYDNAWRNIIKIDPLDEVLITLQDEKKEQTSNAINIFASENLYSNLNYIGADCRSGKTEYSPICGKFTIFKKNNFGYKEEKIIIHDESKNILDEYYKYTKIIQDQEKEVKELRESIESNKRSALRHLDKLPIYVNKNAVKKYIEHDEFSDPAVWTETYEDDVKDASALKGQFAFFGKGKKTDKMLFDLRYSISCKTENVKQIIKLKKEIENNKKKALLSMSKWYSARDAAGLIYKIDINENPDPNLGDDYKFVQKISIPQELQIEESDLGKNEQLEAIIKAKLDKSQKPKEEDRTIYKLNYKINDDIDTNGYLKMRFFDPENRGYTGGYIVNIKQTKCVAIDGSLINYDDYKNRGQIRYLITNSESENPNNQNIISRSEIGKPILLDHLGEGKLHSDEGGTLWLYLKNKPEDYENSTGEYGISVNFTSNTEQQGNVIDKLFGNLKKKINGLIKASFKKMTNFKISKLDSTGHNFFNYIRALLILYVMIYGFMFLLGAVKISQYDLVIRVVKIAIIAGLLNGQTYEFFNKYVFGFVTGFCDQILSNLSGDNLFTGNRGASNPIIFLENTVRRIFLDPTFAVQSFALFSKGYLGVVLYMIIMLSVIILVINIIKAIASYLLSYLALALLLGILAPLFLSFLLFETTKDIAHNLIKVSVYYMIEPIILIFGQIVFCQLFTIYLDNVLSYSVCWKCAFPISVIENFVPVLELFVPSIRNIINDNISILSLPIFCIPWYAPWGYDPTTDANNMISITDCIVLLILAFGMYGYIHLARSISYRLTGAHAPSMIDAGSGAIDSSVKKLHQAKEEIEKMAQEIASDEAKGASRSNIAQN